ncbi:solute carrier family 22 member 7 isoform X3 [Monodelphis domestica]|uniref:solute carrier family 22 member 7 isoform X3 n=1 Tax=Monodelphis domestica TaxID=13616 RepID=UPI0004432668|nr:solute carrier family 22 member 7 isoform X3 [Monodelphis domestica]
MGFEELLKEVGGYGRFQIRNVLLLVLPRLLLPLNFLLPIFIAAVPSHHCALPAQDPLDNLTQESAWLEAYVPREQDGSLSSCYRYLHPHHSNTTPEEQEDQVVPCPDGWSYDQSQFYSTIATQWDLVCERKGLNRVISTFFFIGVLVGAVIFGYLSDRVRVVRCWTPHYGRHPGQRLLVYGSDAAGSDWLPDPRLALAAAGCDPALCPGYPQPLASLWLECPTLCLPPPRWVPESARWLMTQGRVKEAQHYLLQCAALNGRPQARDRLSTEALSLVAEGEKMVRRPSYLDLFRTPRLRHISLCCMVVWFGVNFSYYGLSLDLSGLGLNLYQIQLLFGVVEIPSKMIVYLSVRYAGRRLTEVGALLGTALTVGASLLLPSGLGTWRLVLGVAGKGFSEAAFTTAYLFTSELYPTVLRQTGLGLTALVGRLGGSLAPLATLLEGTWSPLPKVTYGGIALVASATALLLPETRHAELPETIQDVEKKRTLKGSQEEGTPMKVIRN